MGESIVGELHKVAGNPIRLGLPPGRYTVMVRQPEVRYECIADLVEGREPPLALASCVATSLTTGSQKGGVAGTAFESLSVSKQAGWHFEAQLNLPLTLGRPLQPLPNISATPDHSNRGHHVDGWWRRDTWRGALALTAGILAAVGGWNVWNRAAVHPGERLKGDQLSIQLVRHSGGTVAEDAAVFAEGDLFKVRVTCSRAGAVSWQVSVFQGGEVFFPLSSAEPLHCGNEVLLPGAFRLTGAAPVIVCLGLEEDVVPPERLSKEGIGALPATASCTHVRPLPHP